MEYFVSTYADPAHEWQVELLIESFKKLGADGDLTVMLSNCGDLHYTRVGNIRSHQKVVYHDSPGQIKGHRRLDELYTLLWALENGKIRNPYCFLRPHTVIRDRLDSFVPDVRSVVFAPDPFFTLRLAEERLGNFWEHFGRDKSFYDNRWATVGGVIIVNEMDAWLASYLCGIAETLVLEQIKAGREPWEDTVRAAWSVCLAEVASRSAALIRGDYEIAATMNDNRPLPIIDYEHGLPPQFNRRMFLFSGPGVMSFGDPLEVVSGCISTKNAHFMSDLAKSVSGSRAP